MKKINKKIKFFIINNKNNKNNFNNFLLIQHYVLVDLLSYNDK